MGGILYGHSGWVLLFSRIVLGIVMVYYGWPKIKDLKSNGKDFAGMGFRPGVFWGTIVAFLEFFGGLAMIFGVYATFVALFFGFEMLLGTVWKFFKAKKPFPDYSYDIILLALALLISNFGPGLFALYAYW